MMLQFVLLCSKVGWIGKQMKRMLAKLLSTLIFIVIMTLTMTFFAIKTDGMVELYGEKIKYLFKSILVILLFLWIFLDHYFVDARFSPKRNKKEKN